MSTRARAARALAEHLTDTTGTVVNISWDNPSGRPGSGSWRVNWADGPTMATMRRVATDHARWVHPLDVTALRWTRQYTTTAWAAALLTMAEQETLPAAPAEAVALAEYHLHDTDAATWTAILHTADDLARHGDGNPRQMAALLTRRVTKPRNETPPATAKTCPRCGRHLPTGAAGRPTRWCSPACRQAAHRQRAAVMKPRNETPCPGCGQPVAVARTGRPARWCSPACRTRTWRTQARQH